MSEHDHPENVSHTGCTACLREGKLREQRAERGFSDEDVWNLDRYLASVIAGGVAHLRDLEHGCPAELCDDGGVEAGMERWGAILTEISDGFAKYAAEESDKAPLALLSKWWGGLWD